MQWVPESFFCMLWSKLKYTYKWSLFVFGFKFTPVYYSNECYPKFWSYTSLHLSKLHDIHTGISFTDCFLLFAHHKLTRKEEKRWENIYVPLLAGFDVSPCRGSASVTQGKLMSAPLSSVAVGGQWLSMLSAIMSVWIRAISLATIMFLKYFPYWLEEELRF